MRRRISILLCACLLVSAVAVFAGCTPGNVTTADNNGTTIVVTSPAAHALVRPLTQNYMEDGGTSVVTVVPLYKPGQDSHSFEPTAKDIISLAGADVVVCTGSETWLDSSMQASGNTVARVVSMMEACDVTAADHDHDHDHEDACGLINGDEHVWLSVENAIRIVTKITEALVEADKPGDGCVVINETSDNPGAGTPGDGTWLLQEFLRRDLEGAIFGYIPDKEFVLKAHAAGVGGKVSGLLGGKTDDIHGEPVQINDAEVLALSNGVGTYVTPMWRGLPVRYGKMARVRAGKVEIIVTEQLSQQSFDDRAFLLTGADINQYRIVGLKSSAHFRGFFEPLAKAIVTTDPPGIQTANFKQLTFKKVRRPIYPLDPDMEF